MEKRFSLGVTVLLMLVVVVLPSAVLIGLSTIFGWKLPSWITSAVFPIGFYLALEIAGRYGPRPFDAPLTQFAKKHPQTRDRVAFIIGITIALIIGLLPFTLGFKSLWVMAFSFLFALIASYTVCAILGTNQLRDEMTPAWLKSLMAPRKPKE